MSLRCKLGWHFWAAEIWFPQHPRWLHEWFPEKQVLKACVFTGGEPTGRVVCHRCGKEKPGSATQESGFPPGDSF